MGLTAGPVPARVDGEVKAGLLDLVDHAVTQGWSAKRACSVLEVEPARVSRWQARRAARVSLEDAPGGPGEALHAILPGERQAIIALYEQWGDIDRGTRKLAHRGSRLDWVHASESTVLRVLRTEGLVLAPPRPREPVGPKQPWPDWVEYRPCQVWAHDFTAFPRARRDALAVLDLVSRKWLATLLVAHQRGESEHIAAVYTHALEREGLLAEAERRQIAPNDSEALPILLAVSDGGPQMVSGTTREWMALHSLALHIGRPGTPTDQAHIESLFGHIKTEWPELDAITDPDELKTSLEAVRHDYNTIRLHAGLGYVTPDDEHQGRGDQVRKHRREGLEQARRARITYRRNQTDQQT